MTEKQLPSLIDIRRRQLLQAGALGVGIALFPGILQAAPRRELRWGSASLGSTGYIIIEALAQTVQRESELRSTTLATSGGAENLVMASRQEIDFGQTTSTDWPPATKGERPFREPIDARQVFAYTVWNIPLIVRADSDIHSLADLAGKRVMPSTAGGATAIMHQTILEAAGVADQVDWTYGSWNDTFSAFQSGAVDAIPSTLTNGRPSPSLAEIDSTVEFRVLPIEPEVLERAQQINSGLLSTTVSSEQWDKVEGEMLMPAISGLLATHPGVSDEDAYAVCKAVFDNAEQVRRIGSQLQDVSVEFAVAYLLADYPVSAGAARYFQEQGVWRDELIIADPVSS
ncbi:TAXI family TRAP transporter solute-binding subunit [Vreelandella sp. EE22]